MCSGDAAEENKRWRGGEVLGGEEDECCVDRRPSHTCSPTEKKNSLLFSSPGPFCHRVLLAAGEKQVPLTLGFIDFAAKPDWYDFRERGRGRGREREREGEGGKGGRDDDEGTGLAEAF